MFLEYQTAVVSWYKSCKCSFRLFSRQQEEQFPYTGILQMSDSSDYARRLYTNIPRASN